MSNPHAVKSIKDMVNLVRQNLLRQLIILFVKSILQKMFFIFELYNNLDTYIYIIYQNLKDPQLKFIWSFFTQVLRFYYSLHFSFQFNVSFPFYDYYVNFSFYNYLIYFYFPFKHSAVYRDALWQDKNFANSLQCLGKLLAYVLLNNFLISLCKDSEKFYASLHLCVGLIIRNIT